MSMPRSLVMAAALAALLVTGLAIPVAAAKTKLAIVNGIPGKRVDVCVNGVEVKSGLRYGKFVFKKTNTAKARVKFYKRDPRRCGGKLLGKKASGLDDATFVLTRRLPLRVVVFDNSWLATPLFEGSVSEWRHAADTGLVTFAYDSDAPSPSPIVLSADASAKGQSYKLGIGNPLPRVFMTFITKGGVELVPPQFRWVKEFRRLEWILVGTTNANAKLVFINRLGTPSPA